MPGAGNAPDGGDPLERPTLPSMARTAPSSLVHAWHMRVLYLFLLQCPTGIGVQHMRLTAFVGCCFRAPV